MPLNTAESRSVFFEDSSPTVLQCTCSVRLLWIRDFLTKTSASRPTDVLGLTTMKIGGVEQRRRPVEHNSDREQQDRAHV